MKDGEDLRRPNSCRGDVYMSRMATFGRAFAEDNINGSMGSVSAVRDLTLFRVCSREARWLSTGDRRIAVRTLRRADRGSFSNGRDVSQSPGLPRCKPKVIDKYDMKKVG
jgi:hypothetical protein